VVVYVFIKESMAIKAATLVLVAIVTVCVVMFLPGSVKQRYVNLFGGSYVGAVESALDTLL